VAYRVSSADALRVACAEVGLASGSAELLYDRANTVYKLADMPIVARLRYTHGSRMMMERLTASIKVTAWLHRQGFPTVVPVDVQQPVETDGYVATFWQFVDATRPPWEDVESLGLLLQWLHEIGTPAGYLPVTSPLGSMLEDTTRCSWLDKRRKSWLLDRLNELQQRYDAATWTLGCGLIHGDAYAENLIHTRDGPVLADWDSVSYGPREQDIVPTSIRHRFGRPEVEWRQFCAAYGVNPDDLPGLALLSEMREVRTLVPYVRSISNSAAQVEVRRRIDDLMTGMQKEPWHALNLAS
jgi:Ser/Thr protein kinase RdoA (MazF antagonist)